MVFEEKSAMSETDFFTLKEKIIATDLLISSYNNYKNQYAEQTKDFMSLKNEHEILQKNHHKILLESFSLNKTLTDTKLMLEDYKLRHANSELKEKALESHNNQLQELILNQEVKIGGSGSEIEDWKSKYNKKILSEKKLKQHCAKLQEKIKTLQTNNSLLENKLNSHEKISDTEKKLLNKYKNLNKSHISDYLKNAEDCREKYPYEELKVDITGPLSCVSIDSGISSEDSKYSQSRTPSIDGNYSPRFSSCLEYHNADAFFNTENITKNKTYTERSTSPIRIQFKSIASNTDPCNIDEVTEIENPQIESEISDMEIARIIDCNRLPSLISPLPQDKIDDEPPHKQNEIQRVKSQVILKRKLNKRRKIPLLLGQRSRKYKQCLESLKNEINYNRKYLTRKIFNLEAQINKIQEKAPENNNSNCEQKSKPDLSCEIINLHSKSSKKPDLIQKIVNDDDGSNATRKKKNSMNVYELFGEHSCDESDSESNKRCTLKRSAQKSPSEDLIIRRKIKKINMESEAEKYNTVSEHIKKVQKEIEQNQVNSTNNESEIAPINASSEKNSTNDVTKAASPPNLKNKKSNANGRYKILRKGAINKNIQSAQRISNARIKTAQKPETEIVIDTSDQSIFKSTEINDICSEVITKINQANKRIDNQKQFVDHVSEVKIVIEHNTSKTVNTNKIIESNQIDFTRPIMRKRISHFGTNTKSNNDSNVPNKIPNEENCGNSIATLTPSTTYSIKTRRSSLKIQKNVTNNSSQILASSVKADDIDISNNVEQHSSCNNKTIDNDKSNSSCDNNDISNPNKPDTRPIIEYGDCFSENTTIENPLISLIQNRRKNDFNPKSISHVTTEKVKTATMLLKEYLKSGFTFERLTQLLDKIREYDAIITATGIVQFIAGEQNHETVTVNVPLMPNLSYVLQSCLCFMIKLNNMQPSHYSSSIYEHVMDTIAYKLFNLTENPPVNTSYQLAKLFAIICHLTKQTDRLRLFFADALYSSTFGAIPVISGVIEIWPFILPKSDYNTAKDPLVVVMVHHILTLGNKDQNKEFKLREMLMRYGYNSGEFNDDQVLNHLIVNLRDCDDFALDRCFELAFLILGKRCGPIWCNKKIVVDLLIPIFNDVNVSSAKRAFVARLIGPLIRPYPSAMALQADTIIKNLTFTLRQGADPIIEEAIVRSLTALSKKKHDYIVQEILGWRPKVAISKDLLDALEKLSRNKN